MQRFQSTSRQRIMAYELYKQLGPRPSAIRAELISEFSEDFTVSLRTISSWVAAFKALDTSPDDPFEWHRLEEYREKWSLPWESTEFILRMSTLIWKGRLGPSISPPTVRSVLWWWRVHIAAPDLDLGRVEREARRFVDRELEILLYGSPVEIDDLYAYLGFRPWDGEEQRKEWRQAIAEGRIREYHGEGFYSLPIEEELIEDGGQG